MGPLKLTAIVVLPHDAPLVMERESIPQIASSENLRQNSLWCSGMIRRTVGVLWRDPTRGEPLGRAMRGIFCMRVNGRHGIRRYSAHTPKGSSERGR